MQRTLNVLVVDDIEEIAEGMCRIMKREFAECFRAYNGLEALEICEKHHVDVLITDLVMPSMDGLELIKTIRTKHQHIFPIIVITGEARAEMLEEVKQMNIPTFSKPVEIDTMFDYLESAIPEKSSEI